MSPHDFRRSAAILCLLLFGFHACGQKEVVQNRATDDARRAGLRTFWQAYNEATRLRTGGQLSQAADRYRQALQYQPAHEDSLYYLATCLAQLSDYEGAEELYSRLVSFNPSSHRGHFQLGTLLSTPAPGARMDFVRAKDCFLRNVEINREESGPFLRLGTLSIYEGRHEEALRYFDTAAGFQSPDGMFLSASLRYVRGDFRGAVGLLRKVLELNQREKEISGRGIHSEGDIQPAQGNLNPLERAGIQSLLYLYWASKRSGGYTAEISKEFRMQPRIPADPGLRVIAGEKRARPCTAAPCADLASVRDLWTKDWQRQGDRGTVRRLKADLDGDRVPETIETGSPPCAVRIRWANGTERSLCEKLRTVVAAEARDFDGDGATDLLFLEWRSGPRLYRNDGRGNLSDVSMRSGLPEDSREAFALTSFDMDGDRLDDIIFFPYPAYSQVALQLVRPDSSTRANAPRVFRNTGNGKFQEIKDVGGLDRSHGVMSAIAADFDRDGFTDLFLACGGLDPLRIEPSVLLRNQRGKGFAVAAYLPSFEAPANALSAEARDLNRDGFPDILLRVQEGILSFLTLPRRD